MSTHSNPFVPILAALAFAASAFAQQQSDPKPQPAPDPVKGMHSIEPMSPEELAMRRDPYARHSRPAHAANGDQVLRAARAATTLDRLVFDEPGDGRTWVVANTYKASFGADGFTYVPAFSPDAPRNFPVRFALRSVRVGGRPLELANPTAARDGDRVTFDRGAVDERYDLALDRVEQTFVVDSNDPGDVEIVMGVTSELVDDAATPGLRFSNEYGAVHYGDAHVVSGEALRPVPTRFDGDTITIHVPAAERGPGPLVVDPIVWTATYGYVSTSDSSQPDVAYDAATGWYLLVWHRPWSATDMDVWSEFRGSNGAVVVGSQAAIDVTAVSHQNPRVANLNAFDRFLVVTQAYTGSLWSVWGRLRLAGSPAHPNQFQISDPGIAGNCVNPDIGGDSGPGDHFLVVWERQLSTVDFDIHARRVRADTALATMIFVENSATTVYSMPTVSQGNGNGLATASRWLVAYQFRYSATDEDIYGVSIDAGGAITTSNTPIDTSTASDLVPSVSSPATAFANGNPIFMVTYERQAPLEARARILSGGFVNQIPPVNLSTFGLGPFWVRAESDGTRYAVTSGNGVSIGVATFAMGNGALVINEAPQFLPGGPFYPRICSQRSAGGGGIDYAIGFVELGAAPDAIAMSVYHGHDPIGAVNRRVMGCNGLGIDVAERPFLGETLTFVTSGVGGDLPGFVLGTPFPAWTGLCAVCPVGVDLATGSILGGSTFSLYLPADATLIGLTFAMQGFAVGSGSCTFQLRFSDTLDFTIG